MWIVIVLNSFLDFSRYDGYINNKKLNLNSNFVIYILEAKDSLKLYFSNKLNEFEFLDSYAAWFFNNINTWGLLSFQYITDISRWTKAMSLNLRHDVCKNNLWLNMMMIEPTYFPPIFSCYTKRNIFLQLLDYMNTK